MMHIHIHSFCSIWNLNNWLQQLFVETVLSHLCFLVTLVTLPTPLLVEVDSRSQCSAELQEHKPWARPRSRPGLQWAKPVSDPGQTQIRSGSDLNCHNLQCWEANLTQVSYWKVEVFRENSCNYLIKIFIFSGSLPNIFSVAFESRQFWNPEFN